MVAVAEYGVAAHWQYKQRLSENNQEYRWLRDLLDILGNASNSEEFFEHTRLELFQDKVFCFTPKGYLFNLPRGATPIEFAYVVHSQIGNSCEEARINGLLMPLSTPLANGDQVEIITSKAQTPSPTWEKMVITGRARSSIRRFTRNQQRKQFVQLGKAILHKIS